MQELTIQNPDDPIEVAVKTNLEEGMVVNSFAELCRLCGVHFEQGGKQRKIAKAKLIRYIDFAERGQEGQRRKSFLINEIYEVPHVHSRRSGGKYRDRLLRALYYDLSNAEVPEQAGLLITDYDELAEKMGFVNHHFGLLSSYRYRSQKELAELNPRLVSEYMIVCRSRYRVHIEGMLRDALSKGMVESIEEHNRLVFLNNTNRWAEEWEDEIISRLHHKYISDGQALYLMSDSEKRKLYSEFTKAINEEREEHYCELYEESSDNVPFLNIRNYQKKIFISFNKVKMTAAAVHNEVDLINSNVRASEKEEIREMFKESLKEEFKRRYEQIVNAEKKKVEAINSRLAFGDVSDRKPLEHIYADYVSSMDKLIEMTVSK